MNRKSSLALIFFFCLLNFVHCTGDASPVPGDGTAFYTGLALEEADPEQALTLFESALKSTNPLIREESARKLIIPVLHDTKMANRVIRLVKRKDASPGELTLRCAALYALKKFDDVVDLVPHTANTSWDKALGAAAGHDSGFFFTESIDAAYIWALSELDPDLTLDESAVIAGRQSVARSAYKEALGHFLPLLEQNRDLFLRYPVLTGDLGRAFQYADPAAGLKLFAEWESEKEIPEPVLYRIHYYAGRMERSRGRYPQAQEQFGQAIPVAPDTEQKDASIWYLINSAFLENPEKAIPLIHVYQSKWHDDAYFSDIFDSLCRYLVAQRQWNSLLDIFLQLNARTKSPAIAAKYACILGRAVATNLLPANQAATALPVKSTSAPDVSRAFFNYALEQPAASYYYRALSASYIDKNVFLPSVDSAEPASSTFALQFFLGFFEQNLAASAFPYLRQRAPELSIPELRAIAQALAGAGRYTESIRTVALYQSRPDYTLTLGDLYLSYPRPFLEIVEDNARETGIPAEVLFGLIRTESLFDPDAVSWAGALGLSQLMPATANDQAKTIARQGGPDYLATGTIDVFNPAVNLHIGASYLQYLMPRMENRLFALMAYNGGMGRVNRWRNADSKLVPDLFVETVDLTETREYGKSTTAAAGVYAYLYYAKSMETIIKETYEKK